MNTTVRILAIVGGIGLGVILGGFVGWNTGSYFHDQQTPQVKHEGLAREVVYGLESFGEWLDEAAATITGTVIGVVIGGSLGAALSIWAVARYPMLTDGSKRAGP